VIDTDVATPTRRRSAATMVDPEPGDATGLFRELAQHGTKTGSTHILETLHRRGLHDSHVVRGNARRVRRDLSVAQRHHAQALTPYGPLIQRMHLPAAQLKRWEHSRPLALLHYLSTLSNAFGTIMSECVDAAADGALHLNIYTSTSSHQVTHLGLKKIEHRRRFIGPSKNGLCGSCSE
jgi:hypothetical protein